MVVPLWTVRALALRTDPLEETGATDCHGRIFPQCPDFGVLGGLGGSESIES